MVQVKEEDTGRKRRILSIDGGGIKGVFPASFLSTLEEDLGKPIGRFFDLIAGTSTGGILAIGLALGLSARDLLTLYEQRGPEIFGQHRGAIFNWISRKLRLGRWVLKSKYSSHALKSVLNEVFGEKRIGDANTRLVVPAWNSSVRTVQVYKTAHHPRLRHDYKLSAVDVAMATSAAPTYFQQHETSRLVGLTDGGIWANNPAALAVVEAIAVLNWPNDSLDVLSLGCTDETYTIPKRGGLGTLGSKIATLFHNGQSSGSIGMARLLTGDDDERKAIYRVNHTT